MGPELQAAWRAATTLGMPEGGWELPSRTVIEIGSGMGDSLTAVAADWDLVIGIDVHVRGLAATARAVQSAGLTNLRLVAGDAMAILEERVGDGTVAEIHIWFPDPWPKARHHKRRLVRPGFADVLAARLAPGGVLRLATDIPSYAAAMQSVLGRTPGLSPLGAAGEVARPAWRPLTRYEQAGIEAGRAITDLAFCRSDDSAASASAAQAIPPPHGERAQAPREANRSSAAASSHSTAD